MTISFILLCAYSSATCIHLYVYLRKWGSADLHAVQICSSNAKVHNLAHVQNVQVCCVAGLCRHIYDSHILGLAGSFSQAQLADFRRCLPDDCIDYIEEDVQVR